MAYIDTNTINWLRDGEPAKALVLNRPLLELIDILNNVLDDVGTEQIYDPNTKEYISSTEAITRLFTFQYSNKDLIESLKRVETGLDGQGKPILLGDFLNTLIRDLEPVLDLRDRNGDPITLEDYLARIEAAQEDLNAAIGELDEFRDGDGNHISLAQYIDIKIRETFGDISEIEGEDGQPITIEAYIRRVVEENVGDMSGMVDGQGNPISITDYIDLRFQDLSSDVVLRTAARKPTGQNIQLVENDFVEVDTSTGPKTLIMPNTNKLGTTVFLIDIKGTWRDTPAILKGNGKAIMRKTEDMTLNVSNVTAKFVLTSEGWVLL